MNRLAKTVAFLGATIIAQPASAAAFCDGTVIASWTDSDGNVSVLGSWRNDHTQICNLKVVWKGITPDVCASWMAKADAAVAESRNFRVYYSSESNCSTLATYGSAPAPAYVMLL